MVFLFLFGFTLELALGAFTYLAFQDWRIGARFVRTDVLRRHGRLRPRGIGCDFGPHGHVCGDVRGASASSYMLLFYFNYASWPALIMLPVWMGVELLQHLLGGKQVAYMAHFGGLLTGALLDVGLYVARRPSRRRSTKKSRHWPPPGRWPRPGPCPAPYRCTGI